MISDLENLTGEDFCYLTTTGRFSSRPHTIEIWFALKGHTLYMLSGGMDRSDWVKNALRLPDVTVRIKDRVIAGKARLARDAEEDALARQLLFEKYQPSSEDDLTEWSRTSLPVVVDLEPRRTGTRPPPVHPTTPCPYISVGPTPSNEH